jgi:hypothetical protein
MKNNTQEKINDKNDVFDLDSFYYNRNFFSPSGGPNLPADAGLRLFDVKYHDFIPATRHLQQSRPVNVHFKEVMIDHREAQYVIPGAATGILDGFV